MSDFFGGLRGGIQMPEVVWNQGPLPSGGNLPAPLHQTADARINYNSSLLGDLTPYAYGKPGYLSSQSAYLNIPHKVQKIVPVVYLPEAKSPALELVDVSHPIDDGDIAFVLRLNRKSMFCTGLRSGEMRRAGLGTAVDSLVNLPTVNYILAGLQLGLGSDDPGNLWRELFHNLDSHAFPNKRERSLSQRPVELADILHFVRSCVRPFGVARGSEKQGGQDQATISPATWPVSFVTSLTIDGKESNVINIWHHLDLSAGDDLVLRLKLMPVRPYTLNHYYKSVKRQSWGERKHHIWQLVPDILHFDPMGHERAEYERALAGVPRPLRTLFGDELEGPEWQEMGYWHVGRSQLMRGKYGEEVYWHNDLANMLKTSHLDITFQPVFVVPPFSVLEASRRARAQAEGAPGKPGPRRVRRFERDEGGDEGGGGGQERPSDGGSRPLPQGIVSKLSWSASLRLESMAEKFPGVLDDRGSDDEAGSDIGTCKEMYAEPARLPLEPTEAAPPEAGGLPETDAPAAAEDDGLGVAPPGLGEKRPRGGKRRAVSGSLLRVDGSSEVTRVGLL